MNLLGRLTKVTTTGIARNFSLTSHNNANYTCKLLVVGGGTGGCAMAAKFSRRLKKDAVIILEPSNDHYYQPLFTLVGAGVKRVNDTRRDEREVLPEGPKWIQDVATSIDPEKNKVTTAEGHVISYEYVILAVGLYNNYSKIPGLQQALEDRNSGVSTIFSEHYCEKTWADLQAFKGGEAIFTYPDSLIKCPGAPQKIAYLADSYFNKVGIRSKSTIYYNTCLPVIFGVKKYADSLLKVVERKKIKVNYKTVLKEIHPDKKEAVFFSSEDKTKEMTMPYKLLHVSPPMLTPEFLRENKQLADANGFLDVNKYTLQHVQFKNIYGVGDCTNTPNSKTAAAIAKQVYVVEHNLLHTMKSEEPKLKYDGYGACPLLTSYQTCILAEFLYDGVVHETMPCDQSKESRLAFYMKKDLFPFLYWNLMLKGYYHGPENIRKLINPFPKK